MGCRQSSNKLIKIRHYPLKIAGNIISRIWETSTGSIHRKRKCHCENYTCWRNYYYWFLVDYNYPACSRSGCQSLYIYTHRSLLQCLTPMVCACCWLFATLTKLAHESRHRHCMNQIHDSALHIDPNCSIFCLKNGTLVELLVQFTLTTLQICSLSQPSMFYKY